MDILGSKQEKKRLAYLVNRIAKSSPFGKQVIEEAAQAGFSLSFGMQLLSGGYCSSDDKAIVLNPILKDSSLVPTLVHECRQGNNASTGHWMQKWAHLQ